MNVLNEFKNYKREFIQISPRKAMLLHIFSKEDDDFEDLVMADHEEFYKWSNNLVLYKLAADQFFKQFEGNECIAFVTCLRDKCNEMINEHDKKCKELKQLKDEYNSNK